MALPNPMEAFTWGKGGRRRTQEQIEREREIASALAKSAMDYSPVAHPLQGLGRVANALMAGLDERSLDKAETANADYRSDLSRRLLGGFGGQGASQFPAAPGGGASSVSAGGGSAAPIDMTGNEVFSSFMDTVKEGGVTNPFALAAIAATGKRESSFSPTNATRTWSDPSQSGQPGTAGGIMSWRGPRYHALAATGDLSPAGQARFFLQEDPQLIAALNNAGSVEEAIGLMNNAWKFAGYNQPGGEAAARLQAAQAFLPQFQGSPAVAANEAMATGQPVQTASLDPSIGMATPRSAAPDQQFQVGAPASSTPAGQRVLSTMMDPQPMGGSPMPLQEGSAAPQASPPLPSPDMAQAPVASPVQRVAQAMPRNEMSGNVDVPVQQGINPAIIEALSSPYASEQERRIAGILLQQQMEAMDPNNALDAEFRRAQIANMQSQIRERDDPNARDKFGNSVIWGQDADGKWVAMQPSSGGGLVPATTPDGVNLVPPGISNLDLGNQFGIRDRAGNVINTVDKNLTQAEADKAAGKLQGEAGFDLPRVEQNAAQTLGVLERMETHPGREGSTGFIQGMLPARSSDQVDFQSLVDQTQGQSFLQAFQMLKGGGQITEVEGQKATDAISRLRNQRLSDKDYLQAIADLKEVINNGLARARKQAGVGEPAPASDGTDYKSKYGLD